MGKALQSPYTRGCQHLQIKMREIPEGEMAEGEGHDAGESTGGGVPLLQEPVLQLL